MSNVNENNDDIIERILKKIFSKEYFQYGMAYLITLTISFI
jgi:hypothetical protein